MNHPPTILIVDDEHHVRHVVGWKLQQTGAKIFSASDGEEAYEIACSEHPDLVVSDYQMPIMDGLQLCIKLAENETTSEIPVILLTGRGHRVDPGILAKTGVRHLMSKPFSPSDLMEKVESILGLDADEPEDLRRSNAA